MKTLTPPQPQTEQAGQHSNLLAVGSFYLGLSFALPRWVNVETGLLSVALMVGLALAVVGWRRLLWFPFLRRYLFWALLFAVWFGMSAVATWHPDSVNHAIPLAVWIVVIIPGLAGLWRDSRLRGWFVAGAAAGMTVYGITAASRLATGRPVRDVDIEDEVGGAILGVGRNGVNTRAVVVLPFLLSWNAKGRLALVRWLALGFVALWIVTSGGRSGIVAAAMVLVLYVVLQPGVGRRVQAAGIAFILGLTTFYAIQAAGGPAAESTERLVSAIQGERTSSDDIRELAARKAWHAGMDNPLFGIGPRGGMSGFYHPVVDEGRTRRIRSKAVAANAHNTYAEVIGQTGIPGLMAFLALIASVLVAGVRRSWSTEVRVATAALGGVLVMLYFNSALSSSLFYPLALVLAACGSQRASEVGESEPSGSRLVAGSQLPGHA